jgi:hypothetical protein
LDDADEVVKIVVKIRPKQLGFEDPMKSFTKHVEKKRRRRETKWEACFLIVPTIHRKAQEPLLSFCDWNHSECVLYIPLDNRRCTTRLDNRGPDLLQCDILEGGEVRADMVIDGTAWWVREVVDPSPALVVFGYQAKW